MGLKRIATAVAALAIAVVPAAAACGGANLLATMPAAERAVLDAAVAAAPFPVGNRWTATRGASRIDLVGTFHMDDPRMDGIMERLVPAIAAADEVFLEATDDEMKAMQAAVAKNPQLLFIGPGDRPLNEVLSAAEWTQLSGELEKRGIPGIMAARFRPWYAMVMLGVPACAIGDLQAQRGLDRRITEAALDTGVPVSALEPYDTVFRLFSALDETEQVEMIRASLGMAAQAEDMFATLVDSYFNEEHRLIWELSRQSALALPGADPEQAEKDFAVLEERLLNARNRNWMKVILPAAEGRRILVAAGAAHLSGPEGLLNLLAEDGWALERQAF